MMKIVIKPKAAATNEDEDLMDIDQDNDDDAGQGNETNDQEEDNGIENDNDNELGSSPAPPSMPVKRPRGRPRGSGRGGGIRSTNSGTSTPRGRARGRGRRGRGRGSLLIKLPRRGSDETDDDDAAAEGGEGEDDAGLLDVEEKVVPMGGGKPFRSIQGKVYIIDGDEFVTDDDSKGDEKIDQFGNLLGNRRFKASTFALPNRHPQRQYILAIDAARTSGFRDSLYYFRRNPLAFKLNASQAEKDYLIGEGKLGSHLRTRNVTLVTARSAFKMHGSKMLIDGRWVVDDYYESKVLEEITARGLKAGDLVGELPDPNAQHQHNVELSSLMGGASLDRGNAGGAGGPSGSGGGIYRAGGPTTIFGANGWGPYSDGPLNAVRKSILSRDGVTEENWMWMMALRVSEMNDEWTTRRKEGVKSVEIEDGLAVGGKTMGATVAPASEKALNPAANEGGPGVYEPHTNCIFYRSDTQPTLSRWQVVSSSMPTPSNPKGRLLGGTKVGNGAWGLAWIDTVMESSEVSASERGKDFEQRERILREINLAGEVGPVRHETETVMDLT